MANNLRPDDSRVGWICAVQTEYVVACELDEEPEVEEGAIHCTRCSSLAIASVAYLYLQVGAAVKYIESSPDSTLGRGCRNGSSLLHQIGQVPSG